MKVSTIGSLNLVLCLRRKKKKKKMIISTTTTTKNKTKQKCPAEKAKQREVKFVEITFTLSRCAAR